MKIFQIFVALLLASITLQAGELVFHWNKMAESKIYDMEFMPDNDYFVIVTANEFQVRRTEDGEIFKTYPGTGALSYNDIEFTTDSTQLILAYLLSIEFRNLDDLSLINKLEIPSDSEGFSQAIIEIKVDPIRNYIYALVDKVKYINGQEVTKRGILIINNKNFEDVKELTTTDDRNLYLQNLAISKDGKYIAVSNEGSSKLIVWSLETQKKVNEYQICPTIYGNDVWGIPSCIKFSELNSDKIYISGEFPQNNLETDQHSGLFVYSITENKIIDSTFGVGSQRVYGSKFTFFEKENKAITTSGGFVNVIDFEKKNILYNTMIQPGMGGIALQILYNKKSNYFIGRSEKKISRFIYKNDTSVKEINNNSKIIYPNPTNNTIHIELLCDGLNNYYEIFNSNGIQLKTCKITEANTDILNIDFSNYLSGVYFIKTYCGLNVQYFKVIKEN